MSYATTEDILEIFAEAQRSEWVDSSRYSVRELRDRMAAYYASVGAGECVEESCSAPAVTGRRYCQYHQAARNGLQAMRRGRLRFQGACAACGGATTGGKWLCMRCSALCVAWNRERRQRILAAGPRCSRCLAHPPAPGRKRCPQCLERRRAYMTVHRRRCLAADKCPRCQSRPRAPGVKTCQVCRVKNNRYHKPDKNVAP